MNEKIMKQEATYDFLKDEVHCLYKEKKELQSRIDKILEVLNSKREFLAEQMFYGMYIDYKELLFQIDEEIRKILNGSDKK